jgi:PAS domain S-box-containing protein
MLFGEETSGGVGMFGWYAAATPVILAIGAGIKWGWDKWQERRNKGREEQKADRKDTIEEWASFSRALQASHEQEKIRSREKEVEYEKEMKGLKGDYDKELKDLKDGYNKELKDLKDGYNKELKDLQAGYVKDIAGLRDRFHNCELERVRQDGVLTNLQSAFRRMQERTGGEAPATVSPATILADVNGLILQVSPGITGLLQWTIKELVGKNVEVLLPERYKDRHSQALCKLREQNAVPWPEKTISGHALKKDGTEVPVFVNLSAWQDPIKGVPTWRVHAEITRQEASVHGAGST